MRQGAFRNRLHSIQARLLAGFAAMLLLQIAVAASVWWATNRTEEASFASAEGQRRYAIVSDALEQMKETQLRLSEFLRTGGGDDRVKLQAAIAALGEAAGFIMVAPSAQPAPEETARALVHRLEVVVDAATAQREALANAVMTLTQAQNALIATATAAARAPDAATHDAVAAASAESLRPFAAISRYLAHEDSYDEEAARLGLVALRDDLRMILVSTADVPPRLQRLVQTTLAHVDELTPALAAFHHADVERANSLVLLQATNNQISDVLRGTMRVVKTQQDERRAAMRQARQRLRTTLLVAGVLGCLLAGGVAAFLGLSITRPLHRLSEAMRRLAEGNLDCTVPDRDRRDEIGGMAAAVQVFKESIKRNVELLAKENRLLAVNAELEELARVDGLTGLANRRCFDEALAFAAKRCAREGLALSLILIDVDHFKSYNDSYGHQAGDTCLRNLAGAVRREARGNTDLVARYGGEELAVVLPGADRDAAIAVAQRMRHAVRQLSMPHSGNPGGIVTASFGIATARLGGYCHPADLVRDADRCLYAAKTSGRDQVVAETALDVTP